MREETREERVGARGPGRGKIVEETERIEAVTWAEALYAFLTSRQRYDDGYGGIFESEDGDEFRVKFEDCWSPSYGSRQQARCAGAQRQLMGGQYPDEEESSRPDEVVEGVWSDDVATIMLTRSGSSVPDGRRVPPADHLSEVSRTWSQGGVYDTIRNICEYHLGLSSDDWGFVRGDDVHGVGPDDNPHAHGANACYAHCHDAIYVDIGATDLRDTFDSDAEIEVVLENEFYRGIEKHVEECDLAGSDAHTKERAIDVRLDLSQPAGYATAYLSLDEDSPMMEQSVEYQAWAAVEWATARQRTARSELFNRAADADMCLQDSETSHGERLTYDKGENIVCAECGSSISIDASEVDTISEYRTSSSGGAEPSSGCGYGIGESPDAADVRKTVREHIDCVDSVESVSLLMGQLGVDPSYRDVVEEVVDDDIEESDGEIYEIGWGGPPEINTGPELVGLALPDGGRRDVADMKHGGVDVVALELPEERLLAETRLQHHFRCGNSRRLGRPDVTACVGVPDGSGGTTWTYSADAAADLLVDEGYRRPWHAELAMEFRSDLEEFEEPERDPPPDLR